MNSESPAPRSTATDQRTEARELLQAPVRLVVEAQVLPGETENLSDGGALLATAEPLRVTVRLERAGGVIERRGRLVRVQRMGDGSTGLAVEFDQGPGPTP